MGLEMDIRVRKGWSYWQLSLGDEHSGRKLKGTQSDRETIGRARGSRSRALEHISEKRVDC